MTDVSDFMNAAPNVAKTSQDSLFGARDRILAAQHAQLANQRLSQMLPFIAPQQQADLEKSQLANKYYGQGQQSEINQRNALAGKTGAEVANMPAETAAKIMSTLPVAAQYDFYQNWKKSVGQNPSMAGSLNPNQVNTQMAPQQSGNASQFSSSDQQALQAITPAAMAGGGNGMGQRNPILPPVDQLPEQYRQTNVPAMAGGQVPRQAPQSNPLADTSTDLSQDAALASKLAVGDSAAREGFIQKFPTYNSLDGINKKIMTNPDMMKRYSGAIGVAKYKEDWLNSKAGRPVSPEFTAMQNLQDQYNAIGGDQFAKMFTNSGTKGNIETTKNMLDKAFAPGATEPQTLTALSTLTNLQAGDMQKQAQMGGMSKDWEDLWGIPITRDLHKEPIVPDMTDDQLHTFLSSQSPAERKMYAKGAHEMIARQQGK